MSWRNREPFDYARWDYEYRAHHARYVAHVKAHGLMCQECGGAGHGYTSIYAMEPPDPCGYCEMTGKVTRWMRGQWLRWKQQERRATAAKRSQGHAKATAAA
jgi:hypothetical protein